MIFVTGASGQLGSELCKVFKNLGIDYYPITREDFDLTDKKSLFEFFKDKKAEFIIHCAAYTNVDMAEKQRELCYKVNFESTKYLIEVSKMLSCRFVYISTDYVFDGKKDSPYEIYDSINPINYYGYTKAKGEVYALENYSEVYVIRVSFVYGINGRNFVKTIINLSKTKKEINIVCDQIGSQSYAKHLVYGILNIMNSNKKGIYHLTNEGYFSFYDFGKMVFEKAGIKIKINKILSKDYKTEAKRGLNSMLSKSCLIENNIPSLLSVECGISEFIDEMRLQPGEL